MNITTLPEDDRKGILHFAYQKCTDFLVFKGKVDNLLNAKVLLNVKLFEKSNL